MFGENCFSWYDQWGDFLFLFLTSWFLYQCITTDFWSIVICIYWSKHYQNVHTGHWSSQWKIPVGVIWHWEVVFWLYEGSERISLLRAELYLACLWISHCILWFDYASDEQRGILLLIRTKVAFVQCSYTYNQ